jgi:hypothetical protein
MELKRKGISYIEQNGLATTCVRAVSKHDFGGKIEGGK